MKKYFVLLMLSLLALTLVGCGSNKDGANKDSKVKVIEIPLTDEEYAFGVDKNQPELLETVNEFIEEIKEDGTFEEILNNYFGDGEAKGIESAELDSSKDQLVVATNAGFEPFEYTKGDKYYGIDMEIAALLAKKLDKELVISNMDFDAVVLSIGEGKADIAMAGLTVREDRKEHVDFSISYYDAAQMIITKESDTSFDNVKTPEDVVAIISEKDSNFKVGVQTGTTAQFFVEGDEDWEFEGFDATCVGYKSGSLAVQDMLNGNIDLVVIDEAPAKSISEAMNDLN